MASEEAFNYYTELWLLLSHIILSQKAKNSVRNFSRIAGTSKAESSSSGKAECLLAFGAD